MPSKSPVILCCSLVLSVALLQTGPAPSLEVPQNRAALSTPISIAVIFDLSDSTHSSQRSLAVKPEQLAKLLLPLFELNSQTRYSLISVSTAPKLIVARTADSRVMISALTKLASVRREGATALYDACHLGMETVRQDEHSKQVLLVVSDGLDTVSQSSFEAITRVLGEKKVKLYAIDSGDPKNKASAAGARVLDEMASISGGEAFHPKRSEDLAGIVENIVAKVRE